VTSPRLSICIATFRRGAFIGESLDSILAQVTAEVEVVVVDGASPDDTEAVVRARAAAHPALRYHREPVNSGVDADYDKAVGYARGEYCWLLSDDDLLAPGAVARVLAALEDGPDILVVNADCRTPDFSKVLDPRFLKREDDHGYSTAEWEAFFSETARYLTFIGGTVVRRARWLARERERYYGSLFIHLGVLFQQPPFGRAKVLADPLVRIRYGNSMWTPRSFEIWMFRWPAMMWAFEGYSDAAKATVTPREPWRILRLLGLQRALGGYGPETYRSFIAPRAGWAFRAVARAIATLPAGLANVLVAAYCVTAGRWARRELWDMAHGKSSTWFARRAARYMGL
jgi:glycosyltransferase involved in cell wall biosynthesis